MAETGLTLRWPDGDRLTESARDSLIGPGAPFELVDADVLGVRMATFAHRPANLRQLLASAADRFGDQPYLVFPDRSLTFRSILGPVASVAAALADKYGVAKGDRVAIAAANCAEYAITFWAATSLGAVTVAMNGWWTGPEMEYGLELTRPRVLLGDRPRLDRVDRIDRRLPVIAFEDEFGDLESRDAAATLPDDPIGEDDPFVILFTSGTTGRPKGAVLSHRSNIHFVQSALLGAAARRSVLDPGGTGDESRQSRPRIISASPMFHVGGLNAQLVMSTATGAQVIYPPPGRWREDRHLQLSEQYRATNWSLVPTQLWRLLAWPDLDRYDVTSVRSVGGGSAVWPPELLRRLEERLPWIRPGLGLGYGMTETNGLGTSLRAPDTYDHPDSVGEASPGVEVQVRDPVLGTALPEGAAGEICLRTAATFLGYWDNPSASATALDRDGWYHSGDFGHIRGGLLYLEGRRQDMIIRGGENIYPVEIENRLLEHPAIADVAVIGVDHPTLGQEVKAVVVALHGGVTEDDVRAWAGAALAPFKVPAQVEFRRWLPYSPVGKVMKHLLAEPERSSGFVSD
jgi:acyl-CoA synthetase (AMP-forming)/AMP-acid ligase II